jgi:acetyl esterase/lipase
MNTLKLIRLIAAFRGQRIAVSTVAAPSDETDSIVLPADPVPQITTAPGKSALHRNIVFEHRTRTTGKARALKLDLYLPADPGTHPVIVYLSGGGFNMSFKGAARGQRAFVSAAGFVVASIQYRTVSDDATYVDGVADVKSAIRFLRAHAETYHIDPRRVGIWGESAGGYLAAMTGVTNGRAEFEVGSNLESDSAVQAVLDKFGASDLTRTAEGFDAATIAAYTGADNALAEYVNGRGSGKALIDDPAALTLANPVTYIGPATPPFLLFHGSNDRIVSPVQTALLHRALRNAGADSTRYLIEGAGHGDLTVVGSDAKFWTTTAVMGTIVDFFTAKLRS